MRKNKSLIPASFFAFILMLSFSSVQGAVSEKDILFYASYDNSVNANISKGNGLAKINSSEIRETRILLLLLILWFLGQFITDLIRFRQSKMAFVCSNKYHKFKIAINDGKLF